MLGALGSLPAFPSVSLLLQRLFPCCVSIADTSGSGGCITSCCWGASRPAEDAERWDRHREGPVGNPPGGPKGCSAGKELKGEPNSAADAEEEKNAFGERR